MAGRIRSIKPEVLEDELAAGLSDAAWRLWVSSWVLADDHGNVRAGSKYLAACVWQDTSRDADTPMRELIAKGRFQPYAVKGQRYVHIHAFDRHQRVDNAGKPRVPGPEEDDGTWNQQLTPVFADSSATTIGHPQESPLARRARAQSGGETTDLRSPTTTTDPQATTSPPAAPSSDALASGVLRSGVRDVFDHWASKQAALTKTPREKLKLTDKRRKRIQARLRDYSTDDLKLAVDGAFGTEFNTVNGHTDVELVCRDGEHVDRYLAIGRKLSANGSAKHGGGYDREIVGGKVVTRG